jgi:hypothetical protein
MGTLRIEERLYADDWGVIATTSDARYMHDLGDRLRVWPHVRVHAQTGATFYELAYVARIDESNIPLEVPTYRTGDRELSPMVGLTAGLGTRIALSPDTASVRYGLILSGEPLYNRYFQALFIKSRTAFYGTLGFEVEL